MKRRMAALSAAPVLAVLAFSCGQAQRDPAATPTMLLPEELKWSAGTAQLHGLQTATLAGDPSQPGPYAERIRIPAGCRLAPHSHPNEARMVAVLSGTLYYAYGDRFDEARLKALPAGSFFTEPKDLPHYAMAKDEAVVLQLNAIGPAGTMYVGTSKEQAK